MRFDPKSESDIQESSLLPEGEYDFTITGAEEKTSKAGNDMIALSLNVFDEEGRTHKVRDWLLAGDKGARKLRGFCEAVNLLAEYDGGEVTAEMMPEQSGRVKIKINPAGDYPASNGVVYYIRPKSDGPKKFGAPPRKLAPALDDDLPF